MERQRLGKTLQITEDCEKRFMDITTFWNPMGRSENCQVSELNFFQSPQHNFTHFHVLQTFKGFESFSHEQLFFMAYGNLWCETISVIGMKYSLEDTHCIGRIRLLGVLSNSREFHNAFNCHVGQKYHRTDDQKCILW